MRTCCAALLLLLAVTAPSVADAEELGRGWINARDHGATCNGRHDDTNAFRNAIAAARAGGVVFVPDGRCVLTDTLVINSSHPVSLVGTGIGSQIFQRSDKTLLQLNGVNAVMVKDLYLGSAATSAGTSLLELIDSHHNRVDNVTMLGSYYGLHLYGSLLNTVIDLRSGTNFNAGASAFFAATSTNQYWVFAERDSVNHISSNANTFVAPVLEGGGYGIYLQDLPDPSCGGCIRNGEGSLQISGGTIEGVSQTALVLDRMFLPSSVTGVHFEANGIDVLITNSANVRLTAVLSLGGVQIQGAFTRNIQISDSIVQQLTTDVSVLRLQLQNITTDINCTSSNNAVLTPFITPGIPWNSSIIYTNVAHNCT